MPAIINTNIASLNAQRNLNSSQSALQTSLQRLSSGLRINSAKDDAAGLAISERFSTQIRGLNQAARNANDGISLAQTGEGALAAVTDNLQRIRELAVQAANSTNSADDRAALQLEVRQRLDEIDRTASQTSFNGQKLLDGSFTAAAFQIGANAGETISVNGLGNGVRLSATGQIASTTSNVLGAGASGGSLSTGVITPADFSVAAANATSGNLVISPATRLFANGGTPQVDAAFAGAAAAAFNFSTAGSVATQGSTQAAVDTITYAAAMDFSASGPAAHFDVSDGTNSITVALDGNNYNVPAADAGGIQMAADINTQLSAAGVQVTAAWVADTPGVSGHLSFTSQIAAGVASVAPTISAIGADLGTAGLVAGVQTNGANAVPTTNAAFTVDGIAISLTTNLANRAGVASEIQTQLQAAAGLGSYTVAADVGTGALTITHAGSTQAITVAGLDVNEATLTGLSNVTGAAGTAAVASTNAAVTIGGQAVTLNANFATFDAMAAEIQNQMNGAAPNAAPAAGSGAFTVTNNNGAFTISRTATGVGSTAVAITAADAGGTAAGLAVAAGVSTAGQAAIATTNATLTIDGKAFTLTGDHSAGTVADIATELGNLLNAATPAGFGPGAYTVAANAGQLVITNTTAGSAAVAITASDANAGLAGFADASGTAGVAGGSITLADLTINGTSLASATPYASAAALATAINSNVTGVYATVNNAGALTLSSAGAMTFGGTADLAATNLNAGAAGTVAAASGSLTDVSVTTAAGANTTIQRIDAALTSVSNLRSTFGAVQNRFESVISSLTATSENLTAARSRIQDTDFAAETAQLTRNQILQQAGTAMLAQANQLPNTVLSLLR